MTTIRRNGGEYRMDALRVLSMWQPWASFVLWPDPVLGFPLKRHETRSWRPTIPVPFTVAIHATKKRNEDVRAAIATFRDLFRDVKQTPDDLVYGAILGLATVVDVHLAQWVRVDASDRRLGNYSFGRHVWRLEHTIILPTPIPFSGRQEPLYRVPEPIADAIADQLMGVTGVTQSTE